MGGYEGEKVTFSFGDGEAIGTCEAYGNAIDGGTRRRDPTDRDPGGSTRLLGLRVQAQ
jgi:hypothetical protein